MTKRHEMRTQAAIFSPTGMWGCNWSHCVHLTSSIASIIRKGWAVMICCVVTGNVSCLYDKNRWIFSVVFACLTLDWNCIGHSTIEATRRNYKSDSTWRETEKIITFIPVFTTQCPPHFLSPSAFSFTFDGCDVRATCLSPRLIGLIISLLMCEAVSSSHSPRHKPTNGLFQIEWRQIIPRWHRRVSVIVIRGYTDHRLLP